MNPFWRRPLLASLALISVVVFLLVSTLLFSPAPVRAAGTVGTGTPASCDYAAIVAAVGGASGGLVTFNCGAAPLTIFLTTPINIYAPTTFEGANKITLSGNSSSRIFHVVSGGALTLRNIVLTNGYGSDWSSVTEGGAIVHNGPLVLENVTIRNSVSVSSGGAIAGFGAPMTATNSLFENNSARNGGALFPWGVLSVYKLNNTILRGNVATYSVDGTGLGGAALVWEGARMEISGGAVISNTALGGGGVALRGANSSLLIADNTELRGNISNQWGGAIDAENATVDIDHARFLANESYHGGAIMAAGGGTTIVSTLFTNNRAEHGGALYARDTNRTFSLNIENSTFDSNTAESDGGAVHLDPYTIALMNNVTLSNNVYGYRGGGVMVWHDSTLILDNVTISDNSPDVSGGHYGGGIYSKGDLLLGNVTIANNGADSGGAVYREGNNPANVKNTVFANNTGGNCAGPIFPAQTFSLSTDTTCGVGEPTNKVNQPAKLAPLADNGGEVRTMLPQSGSLLIDGGTCVGAPATDARGVTRPQFGGCDIGAVEVAPAPVATNTPTRTPTKTPTPTPTVTLKPGTTPIATATATATRTPNPTSTPDAALTESNFLPAVNR